MSVVVQPHLCQICWKVDPIYSWRAEIQKILLSNFIQQNDFADVYLNVFNSKCYIFCILREKQKKVQKQFATSTYSAIAPAQSILLLLTPHFHEEAHTDFLLTLF